MLGRDPDDVCDSGVRMSGVERARVAQRAGGAVERTASAGLTEAEREALHMLMAEHRRVKKGIFTEIAEDPAAGVVWESLVEVTEEEQEILLAAIGIEGGVNMHAGRAPVTARRQHHHHRPLPPSAAAAGHCRHCDSACTERRDPFTIRSGKARRELQRLIDSDVVQQLEALCGWLVGWLAHNNGVLHPELTAADEGISESLAAPQYSLAPYAAVPPSFEHVRVVSAVDGPHAEAEVHVIGAFHRFLLHNVCEYYGLNTRSEAMEGGAADDKVVVVTMSTCSAARAHARAVTLGVPVGARSPVTTSSMLLPPTSLAVYLERTESGPEVRKAPKRVRTKAKSRGRQRAAPRPAPAAASDGGPTSTFLRTILGYA